MKKRKESNDNRNNFLKLVILLLSLIVIINGSFSFITKGKENYSSVYNEAKEDSVSNTTVINDASNHDESDVNEFENVPVINDDRGVPIICFHSINDDPSVKNPIIIYKDKFEELIKSIKDNGYTTLTMEQLNNYLFNNKPIPEKSVVLTFDDGYSDNYFNAVPILKKYNMTATIFVIPSYLNRDGYLTEDQVKELSNSGIDIESHTVTHRDLPGLSYEDQLNELKNSKEQLEKLINKPIIAIAYPEGKYNEDTKKAFSETGYSMGFTTERGYADREDNSAELNRICVDYTYKPQDILKVLTKLKK